MDAAVMTRSWWIMLLRGLLAVSFGLIALFWPAEALLILMMFFAAYALVDGVFALAAAMRKNEEGARMWLLVVEGISGLIIGILTVRMPGVTLDVLLMLIAAWLAITGITRIAIAIELRRQMQGERLLLANGIVSVLLGLMLFAFPGIGAVALIRVVGFFVLLLGIALMAVSFGMRAWFKNFLTA